MVLNDLDDLYRDPILDHCRHPRNNDRLESPDVSGRAVNPFCGDEVDFQIVLESGRVAHVGIQGVGCAINQASASMLSVALAGKSPEEIQTLSDLFKDLMSGRDHSEEELNLLGELRSLSGIQSFPVRIKCTLLAWSALEEGMDGYRQEQAG